MVIVERELSQDDGRLEYEIEFIYRSGSSYTEYDYEIDANTGAIVSNDRDAEHYRGTQTTASTSAERAKQIALNQVSGATASNIRDFDIDEDDGRLEYEVKIWYNGAEYEFTIDASTAISSSAIPTAATMTGTISMMMTGMMTMMTDTMTIGTTGMTTMTGMTKNI